MPDSTPDDLPTKALPMSPARAVELARLLDQAPSFIAVLRGPEHRFEFFNQAYQRLVGDRELLNRTVQEVFPELEGQQYLGLLDEILQTGKPYTGQASPFLVKRHASQDLEQVYVDFVYQPLFDKDGKVSGVFVQGSEVTDRVQAFTDLERVTALLRVIERQMPTFMYVKDRDGRMLYCNPAVAAGVGKPIEEILGRTDAEFIGPGERTDLIVQHDQHVMDTGTTATLEERLEGSDRVYLSTKAPYRRADGSVAGLVGVSMDVTEQIETREALSDSRERFRLAESSSSFGSFDLNVDKASLTWSPSVLAMYGRSGTGEVPLQEALDAIHPEDKQRATTQLAQMMAADTAQECHFRHRIVRPDQTVRWIAVAARSIVRHGRLVGISGVIWDETEREQLVASLHEADRRKNEFLATLAHELRNPLAPIRTASSVLANPEVQPDQIAWAQAVIQRQVSQMAKLLDDLLDVTRITQGKMKLKRQKVGLAAAVANAIESVQSLIDQRHHRLSVTLPQPDPQLNADPVRLVQIVSNLLTNAAKYSDPGGEIAISAQAVDDHLVLQVIDNGIGLDPHIMSTLFEMFTQSERTIDRSDGGLGVGLALVKGLIELHGGSVNAASDGPGCGSTFTVKLPLAASSQTAVAGTPTNETAKTTHRVLVADDNHDSADSMALLLELDGHEVQVAYDGQSALEMAQSFRPQIAIVDIGMPRMDGYEVARALRAEPWSQSLRLFALTGWGQDEHREEALRAGFDEHFTKPVDPAAIRALLSKEP